jgi:hypothetical protein
LRRHERVHPRGIADHVSNDLEAQMGIRAEAEKLIDQYYDNWQLNIQTMIDQAQQADDAVDEIVSLQETKTVAAVLLTALFDTALNVVLPGGFAFCKAWKAFEEANKARAAAVQAMTALSAATKSQVQAIVAEMEKTKVPDSQSPADGRLRVDVVNQMIDGLEKKKADKSREHTATKRVYSLMPNINLARVLVEFPTPALLGDVSADVRYAFEWTLMKHYVAGYVTVVRPVNEWGRSGADRADGLSNTACDKIFRRFTRKVDLHDSVPLVGKQLRPVQSYDDLIVVWGAKLQESRVSTALPGNR